MEKLVKTVWNFCEKIAKKIIFGIFKLMKKEITEQQWTAFMQFVKFGIIGVSNTLISYIVLNVCVYVFNLHYLVGNLLGFIISVLNAFYWNNKYVFKEEQGQERVWWKALLKTYMSYAFSGLFLTTILMYIWVDLLSIPVFLTVFLNVLVCTPINFIINKLWAFGGKKEGAKTGMRKERNNIKIGFYIIMAAMILAFLGYCLIYKGNPLEDILFIDPYDTFMDYFNSLVHVKDMNPYGPPMSAIYPPLSYMIYAALSRIIPREVFEAGGFAVRSTVNGQMSFMIYMLLICIVFCFVVFWFKKGKDFEKIAFIIGCVFTTPFLYTLERGNLIFVAMIFASIYLFTYDSDKRYLREISYISLAVAVSIKIYPAVLGVLLLKDKRFKDAIRCIIYGAIIFVVPFIFFGGFKNIIVMAINIVRTSGSANAMGLGFKINISNTFGIIWSMLGITGRIPDLITKLSPYALLVLGIVATFFIKKKWKYVALISALLAAVPNFSYAYALIFMIPAVMMFLDDNENRTKRDWIYMLMFACMFAPIFRGVHSLFGGIPGAYPVTLGTFIEGIAVLGMIVFLTIEGFIEMYRWFGRKKNEAKIS